jgi:hypothetical protein
MSAVSINSEYVIMIDATSKLAPDFKLEIDLLDLSEQKAKQVFESFDSDIITFEVISDKQVLATLQLDNPKVGNWTLSQYNTWFKSEITPHLLSKL